MTRLRILHNREVIRAPYDQNRQFDIFLEQFVNQVKNKLDKENDDYLTLLVGPPGSGKSGLMQHMYECYDPENCSVDFIAFERQGFANALKRAKDMPKPRFLADDEANINKRDSMSQYNKDMIDLYFAIRGLNIFHVWCNPSADMIDKPFIEERIKRIILIYDKSPGKRTYWFFKTEALLKIYETCGNLKLRNLIKMRDLAHYKGWFREYNGKLKDAYLAKKQLRMDDKVDTFHEKWGGTDKLTREAMAKKLSVSVRTIRRYELELVKRGLLVEGDNWFRNSQGRVSYAESAYLHFLDVAGQGIIDTTP